MFKLITGNGAETYTVTPYPIFHDGFHYTFGGAQEYARLWLGQLFEEPLKLNEKFIYNQGSWIMIVRKDV